MNRLKLIKWLIVSVSVVMLSACGGGSSGSSTPVAPTPEEIQAGAIETINNYDGSGEAPTVEDYANAGVTDVNEGNIDSVNEAILEDDGSDTQEDIQDIADVAGLIYEDAENGDTNGWTVYSGNGTVTNVYNPDKAVFDANNGVAEGSRVIYLSGDEMNTGYQFGGTWDNKKDKIVEWSMKAFSRFTVFAHITTTEGDRHLTYHTSEDISDGISADNLYIYFNLGADANDGTWKTFKRNLETDLKSFEPNNELLTVNYFKVRGDNMVDDIKFIKP